VRPILVTCAAAIVLAAAAQMLPPPRTLEGVRVVPAFTSTTTSDPIGPTTTTICEDPWHPMTRKDCDRVPC